MTSLAILKDLTPTPLPDPNTFANTFDPNTLPTPCAYTSTRKFDKHGDWHYFIIMPRVGFWMMFNKSRNEKFTRAYWYEDR